MIDELARHIWLLLTAVMPGLFTYGTWRVLLVLEPSGRLDTAALGRIDESALATTGVIVAIALAQQTVAITLEAVVASLAKARRAKWPNLHALFCGRFQLASAGRINDHATRVIGQFFLSLNICIGLGLLLGYFLVYEAMSWCDWIPLGLAALLGFALAAVAFRMLNAKWAIEECIKGLL